ncbi:trans-cinnamate 4-monooxygenase-like protein [Corchorus olitorius]|uniref:Trans-cinnamate 4-monooxygenase-like protein n=1 Tax=Corchorus olitorius TaxID=93759 RepID=A0A1R3JGR8_9ROSI|nr:trans-cinnamate 4-monooxygenase-like protein [Corchorus olitorius]
MLCIFVIATRASDDWRPATAMLQGRRLQQAINNDFIRAVRRAQISSGDESRIKSIMEDASSLEQSVEDCLKHIEEIPYEKICYWIELYYKVTDFVNVNHSAVITTLKKLCLLRDGLHNIVDSWKQVEQ